LFGEKGDGAAKLAADRKPLRARRIRMGAASPIVA